jgi:AcrR family transcriptional regulator
MSAIATTLGGSKSTLWSYFPSKAALFEATLDHAIAKHHARLSENLVPGGDLETALGRFAKVFVGTVTSPRAIALHRLVQGEAGRFPEVGEIFYRRVPRRTNDLLADFLARAMRRGLLRQDDPLLAAHTFIALCMGGTYQLLMLGQSDWPGPEEIAQDVAQVLAVFLRAYAPDSSPPSPGSYIIPEWKQ